MFTFGAGVMIGTPYQDGSGNILATPSPVQFGVLQDVSVDESFELKKLYGANKFPVALGQGKGSVSLKAKLANINAELFNAFMYGTTLTQTYENIYNDLAGTLITGASNQIVPTVNGTALADLGVVYSANGQPLTRVATAPTSGQYGFNSASGLYYFSAVDVNKTAFISYAYGKTVASAEKLIIPNTPMGQQPIFAVDFAAQYAGKTIYFHYPQVICTKISRTFKNDDFTITDMDMDAFADSSGNICYQYFYE